MQHPGGDGPPPFSDEPTAQRSDQDRDEEDQEQQFRALIDAVEEYAIFRLDPEGYIASWNTGAERIKGYTAAEIIGTHFSAFYTEDDRTAGIPGENLTAAAERGSIEDEGWRVRADGTRFWANVTITAIRDSEGRLNGFAKVTRDMTDRREYEQQLEAQARWFERQRDGLEHELNEVFERVDDALCAFDDELRFTYVNDRAASYLEKSSSDLLGRTAWEALDLDEDNPIFEQLKTALATQEPMTFERYSDQLGMWTMVRVYPSDTGLSVYFRDITQRKERELELERYEVAVETVWDAITVLDSDDRFVLVNEAFCELTGYDREEVIGEHATLILDEATYEHAGDLHEEVVGGIRDAATLEYDLITKRGDTVPVEARFGPVEYADGSTGGAGVIRDITARKERERALEKSQRLHKTLIENVPSGGIALLDHDLRYQVAGGEIFDIVGLPTEDIVGRRVDELYTDAIIEQLVPRYRGALEGESSTFEIAVADRQLIMRTIPVRDEQGSVFAALGMTHDITEHKERERELHRYETLIEASTDVNAILDTDGTIQYVTPSIEYVLGYPPDELQGANAFEYIHPDDRDEMKRELVRLVNDERSPLPAEFRFQHADGSWNWLEVRGRDLTDDPDINGVVVYTRDITDRKEYEQQLSTMVEKLEASNERLEQFAYLASHDLQEPLRMVSSYLQLIERRYDDVLDEDGKEFLEFAVDGADRMREMITSLLEYSRVETHGAPVEPVDLDSVFTEAREALNVKIAESGAEISVDSLPTVAGDPHQLRQVFQNLLENAINFSGDAPPSISVSAERTGDKYVIAVSDEGLGINPGDAERIFEVFQSGHSREEHDGTGIGLALVERIVERHGGEIWVDSTPGEGATFSFTLPAVAQDEV